MERENLYKVTLSEKSWLIWALISDVGWLTYLACSVIFIVRTPWKRVSPVLWILTAAVIMSAVYIILGICEIIRERKSRKILLTQKEVQTGLRRTTASGLYGAVAFLLTLAAELVSGDKASVIIPIVGICGGVLCYIGGKVICNSIKSSSE